MGVDCVKIFPFQREQLNAGVFSANTIESAHANVAQRFENKPSVAGDAVHSPIHNQQFVEVRMNGDVVWHIELALTDHNIGESKRRTSSTAVTHELSIRQPTNRVCARSPERADVLALSATEVSGAFGHTNVQM